jgi:predicted DNA-binding antitoxin AbrB/MazE fold protein
MMAARTITAIYEHGVLRPISTVELPEHAQVELDVRSVTLAVDPIDAAFIAAGLITNPPIVSPPTPGLLTPAERSALARRIGAGMALSQIILDEREGR